MVNIVHFSSSADGKASGAKKAILGSKKSKYARASPLAASKGDVREATSSEIAYKKRNVCSRCFDNICIELKEFFAQLPSNFRFVFVGAFLAYQYRPEWGNYMKWNPALPLRRPAEEVKRKKEKPISIKTSPSSMSTKSSRSKKKRVFKTVADAPPRPLPHDHYECAIVKINVSGRIFQPQARTLNQFPNTLLGDQKRMMQYYYPEDNEFFFDRHRTCFEAILTYYQTGGIIRKPAGIGWDQFIEEVKFYDLGKDVLRYLEHKEGIGLDEDIPLPKNLLRRKIWLLFEYPESSHQSRIVASVSILAVSVSIVEFCMETIPLFCWEGSNWSNNRNSMDPSTYHIAGQRENLDHSTMHDPFFLTETVCIAFFIFEYVIRLLACPDVVDFLKEFSNVVDLVSIIPYFVSLVNRETEGECGATSKASTTDSLTIFRVFRLVRVFRIFKLSRHNRGLKILGKTLKASVRELGLFMFFLFIGVIVFSSAMYFVEAGSPSTKFDSIPTGFWFSIVTMTTLGYGDIVPSSIPGKIIGTMCAIAGVLAISLPVPVIVSNFNTFYKREVPHIHEQSDHVEQCPYYPAWYDTEGNLGGGSNDLDEDQEDSFSQQSVGQNKPDNSDSEFEELKKDACLQNAHKKKRKARRSSATEKLKK